MKKSIIFLALFSTAIFAQETPVPSVPVPTAVGAEVAPVAETVPVPVPAVPLPMIVQPEPTPAPVPVQAPAVEPPKPVLVPAVSMAQKLSGINLPKGCVEDFTNILEKPGFSMANFIKELPPAVAKVKLQLKSPFGKPKDDERTNAGLTVGCIKSLPESPAEIQSLLKDIGLKVGLDLAADMATSAAENSIPANIPANAATESGSGGGTLKTVISTVLITGGLSTIVYGLMQNSSVSKSVDRGNGKAAVDAESSRNISYGVGGGLLAGGLIVLIVF
jgi:hypothetical protein